MFGLNDNESQKSDTDNDAGAADAAPAQPDNPFDDGVASTMSESDGHSASASTAPALQDEPAASSTASEPAADDNLMDLKQQALKSLQPLVNHLDQSPEEKFKTTMMLIQATDNSSLVGQAYEAANQISDEKARAQALLDVVNEINYFTQHSNGENSDKA